MKSLYKYGIVFIAGIFMTIILFSVFSDEERSKSSIHRLEKCIEVNKAIQKSDNDKNKKSRTRSHQNPFLIFNPIYL